MAFSSLPQSLTGDFPNSKNLYLALFSAYGAPYAFAAFLKIIQDCLAFLQPQLLRWLLYYVSTYQAAREGQEHGGPPPPSPLQGFSIAALMFIAAVIQTFILHQVSLRYLLFHLTVERLISQLEILVLPIMLRDWNASPSRTRYSCLQKGPCSLQW